MKKLLNYVAGVVGGLVVAFAIFLMGGGTSLQDNPFGSVAVSSEYTATSTAANTSEGATVTTSRILKSGPGALGQVTITGANTGSMHFYNATTSATSGASGRAPGIATSTILLASIPASAAAGTYTFDAQYNYGLYVVITGLAPTSTVTFR